MNTTAGPTCTVPKVIVVESGHGNFLLVEIIPPVSAEVAGISRVIGNVIPEGVGALMEAIGRGQPPFSESSPATGGWMPRAHLIGCRGPENHEGSCGAHAQADGG